ncbi:YtxH domain-containing protein [Aerococcaceae bacterium DSM 111020]|nr:YtxH domain-containing protein [Aerococcaceae bacterium DSM 111020]
MSKFGSGLFWGAVFGGLAGLMNAPRKGKETRAILKTKIDQTTEDVNDLRFKVDNLSTAVKRLSDEGIQSASEASQDIQTALREFNEESSPRIKRVNNHVETLQDDIEKAQKEFASDEDDQDSQDNDDIQVRGQVVAKEYEDSLENS